MGRENPGVLKPLPTAGRPSTVAVRISFLLSGLGDRLGRVPVAPATFAVELALGLTE
jgi:hypothetical protein